MIIKCCLKRSTVREMEADIDDGVQNCPQTVDLVLQGGITNFEGSPKSRYGN